MRIAYLTRIDLSRENGVLKKIYRQISTWDNLGHTVKLFAFSPLKELHVSLNKHDIDFVHSPRNRTDYFFSNQLFQNIQNWQPDIVYYRFVTYYPFLVRLMKLVPTIIEINTNELTQYKIDLNKLVYTWHLATRKFAFSNCSGFTFLTNETARNYKEFNKPQVIIGDSIDLKSYPTFPPPQNSFPHLVFIGGVGNAPWYGIDKLIILAKRFPHWVFHIIGQFEIDHFKPLPENIIFHGYLPQDAYSEILMGCDVAISSLALSRISMNETTPLKTREYLAYGLPIITAYKDTDFPNKVPFILELPNTEENVSTNLQEIETFVSNWIGKRVTKVDILHLDVELKEKSRLSFMQNILSNGGMI